jgi:hypothetical protein
MEKRWKDDMEQGTIGGTPLLMGTPCMLLVVERLTGNEIVLLFSFSVLIFR